ncbi:MAG: TonB-dependent receptor [bacterium]
MSIAKKLTAGAAALAITAALGSTAYAQETTSDIRGVVTDDSGAPLANAMVSITDTRTGVTRTITTGPSGAYTSRNLPVGGPYTVSVASNGYQGEKVEGVTLSVGDTTDISFDLNLMGDSGDEFVVVAKRSVVADVATGPSATFNVSDIQDLPSGGRDIKDIIRLDPRVYIDETFGDGIFCAGNTNRSNSLTVDGVRQNDDFGLNGNGYPTQRLPFPYDIVEQIAVELAPFDVEYGGFTGCNVNVVTRSGGNDFSGRVSYDYVGNDFGGDSLEGAPYNGTLREKKVLSGYLEGPILEDKLFFALGYEKFQGEDGSTVGTADSNAANRVSQVTNADISAIQNIASTVYGFDAGGLNGSFDVEDERYFAKVTAYLNDQHRLEASYQHTLGNDISVTNTSTSRGNLSVSSNWYDRSEEMDVYTARLFSDWSDALSTELRITSQDRRTGQDSLGGDDFAQFEIGTPGGGTVFLGSDSFRQANELTNDIMNIRAIAEYDWNEHSFKAGYERDEYEVFNKFIPFAEGVVECNTIADFQNQTCSLDIYQNAPSNNEDDGAATFKRVIHTFFVQDDWDYTDRLDLTLGLRLDSYEVDDKPTYNPNFQLRYGIRNDDNLQSKYLLQPRLGFSYDLSENEKLSGGVARFSGGDPAVWTSNAYSNAGYLGITFGGDITGFDGFNLPQPILDAVTASGTVGNGRVDAIDPDFEIPSVWRFSMGYENIDLDLSQLKLGNGWHFGADLLYSIEQDPVVWKNLSLQRIGTAPDGRPIYQGQDLLDPDCPANVVGSTTTDLSNCSVRRDDILLTNSDHKPAIFNASTYLANEWTLGTGTDVDLSVGYSYVDAEDVNPRTSSTATSNFENVSVVDYNNLPVATSNYEVKHRFTTRLGLEHEFFNDAPTKLSLFGQLNSGRPYSYNFDTNCGSDAVAGRCNMFGDSDDSERRSLLYVPTGLNDPLIDTANSDPVALQAFLDYVAGNEDLRDYAGRIVDRNAFNSDWWGKVDLRLQQEVPLPKTLGDDKLRLILDIDNVTNLINDEWGVYREIPFGGGGYNAPIVEAELSADGSQYVITDFNAFAAQQNVNEGISVWDAQISVRYDF